jgi:hypothetical protein
VLIGQVEHMGHECDLALLSVPDDSFWAGLPSLEFGNLPVCIVCHAHARAYQAVDGKIMCAKPRSFRKNLISQT